jgi:hypothetical protein
MTSPVGRNATRLAVVAVLSIGAMTGAGMVAADQPDWADGLFDRLEQARVEYNANAETGEAGFLEQWLLRNARVNLYVDDRNGSETVFSFRTDERLRITELRQRERSAPTLQVRASKTAVERVTNADDKSGAISREVWTGNIRVQRVVSIVPGVTIVVGLEEVLGAVAAGAILGVAGASLGAPGPVSAVWQTTRRGIDTLADLGRSLWQNLGKIATVVTLLEQLDLLDRVRGTIASVRASVRTRIAGLRRRLRRDGSDPDRSDERRNDERGE